MAGLRFGDFLFDEEQRELTRCGESVRLSPKAFDLLGVLISRRPRAVRKEELFECIWPDTIVEQANLNNLISEIRRALSDDQRSIIATRSRYGYAFTAPITDEQNEPRTGKRVFRLLMGSATYELQDGRNLIGREEDCAVVVDSPEVSRYHAAIDIDQTAAVLTDLGSKNGTSLNGSPVKSATTLHNRDEVAIGRIILRFRTFDRKSTTISDPRSHRPDRS